MEVNPVRKFGFSFSFFWSISQRLWLCSIQLNWNALWVNQTCWSWQQHILRGQNSQISTTFFEKKILHNLKQAIQPPAWSSSMSRSFCTSWFQIFSVSSQGKHAAWIHTIHFFIEYSQNAKHPPDKKYVSCSSRKIVRKLAYLAVKMTSLDLKLQIVMKVPNLRVSKLHISFRDIKLSEKFPILEEGNVQVLSMSRQKMLHFDLHQPQNCVSVFCLSWKVVKIDWHKNSVTTSSRKLWKRTTPWEPVKVKDWL